MPKICFICGTEMILREMSPCLVCGGEAEEIKEFYKKKHKYYREPILDNNILCDFDVADITGTDPCYWGFPKKFDWDKDFIKGYEIPLQNLSTTKGAVCPKCQNTEIKQNFIIKNSEKNGVIINPKYLPYYKRRGYKITFEV